ncbi:MAG: hypothetical protein HY287_07515 [Planctomycetes bacterium]|nr:hypothetical protein [Planctomycetota bacterium]MBI3834160.1 hypothetical protein [Planctomycetota bacterium]
MPRIPCVVVIAAVSFTLIAEARPPQSSLIAQPFSRLKQPSRGRPVKDVSRPPSERVDDPPLPISAQSTASSPSTASNVTFNGHTSIQVNVNAQGNNIVGDAANEPSIAVNPVNPKQIAIAWRQFDNVASNFRQAGRAYSTNGGQTWTFPGVLDPGLFRSDPVLGFDGLGNFYYASLTIPVNNPDGFEMSLFKSTNGGVNWSAPVYAYGGDKAWIVVDDRVAGAGAGHIYETWTLPYSCCFPNDFSRSINGAASFQLPISLPNPHMMWGTLDTDSNGVLYLGGATLDQRGHVFFRSLDAKNPAVTPTFSPPKFVDLGGFSGGFGGDLGPNPVGLLGQVWVAANPGKPGHVYMLGSVIRDNDPTDVMFARSVDGGQTWSPPRRVNDDPEGNFEWQWFGTLAVAPNGRLDAIWNDTRTSGDPAISALFYSFSMDEGQTWSANEQVSPKFNSHVGFPNQPKIGDYYHMISDDGGANLAYSATFNGEQDVYFLRIRQDCNHNGIDDDCDTSCGNSGDRCDVTGCGLSVDCNHNHVPDECEPIEDCNHNGTRDICEIGANPALDCNANRVLDSCESGQDCNGNQVPDVCDVFLHGDCNHNGIPDDCDIAGGHSMDRNRDGVPDECQGACCDCDGCTVRSEYECFVIFGIFSGPGTQCGDANACHRPVFANDLCTQAEEIPSAPQFTELFDNRCAFLSGPEPSTEFCPDPQPIYADLWYQYIAPCTGTLQISTCDQTDFDAIMAAYHSGASCVCPSSDATFLQCQDDSCGIQGGPPLMNLAVTAGQCYTIRVGGWNGSIGSGELSVSYLTACNPTDLNGDGVTDFKDFARFVNCYGPLHAGCAAADFNHDGVVNLRDYQAMFVMFGK